MDRLEKIEVLEEEIRKLNLVIDSLNRENEIAELLENDTSMVELNKETIDNCYSKIKKYTCKLKKLELEQERIEEYYVLKKYLLENEVNDFFRTFIIPENEEHLIVFADGYLCEVEFDDKDHYINFYETLEVVNDDPYEFKEVDYYTNMIDMLTTSAQEE